MLKRDGAEERMLCIGGVLKLRAILPNPIVDTDMLVISVGKRMKEQRQLKCIDSAHQALYICPVFFVYLFVLPENAGEIDILSPILHMM